jgi:hypothetical protein
MVQPLQTVQETNSDDSASSPESDLHEGWSDMDALFWVLQTGKHYLIMDALDSISDNKSLLFVVKPVGAHFMFNIL